MRAVIKIYLFSLFFLFFTNSSAGRFNSEFNLAIGLQQRNNTDQYQKGIEALEQNNFEAAEDYFAESIQAYEDAPSYFELAKLYLRKDTPRWRNKALDCFQQAVMREPNNLDYRYGYASLLVDFARLTAIEEYKRIIEIDSEQIEAWNSLARLKEAEFEDFHNSVRNMDGFMGSLEEFAMEDFTEAESYLKKVIELDSANFDANFKLGELYENAEMFEKSKTQFEKCDEINSKDVNTHLYLGLSNYKIREIEQANIEFQEAFKLMDREERKEFTFYSAKLLLEPAFKKLTEKYADWEMEQFIDSYWSTNDPLYLTDFNERVIEHYARVAYAKIHCIVGGKEKTGWQSDMGEFLMRYGEPGKRMRIRPAVSAGGDVHMKTEVWYYNDMTLAFTDFASSGNFQYSTPSPDKWKFKPQFGGDSQWFADNLKTIKHENYIPKYEGPTFSVPFDIVQFRSTNDRNKTDVYFNYALDLTDSVFAAADINYNHKLGVFYFDRYHRQLYRKKKDILESDIDANKLMIADHNLLVNATRMSVQADSGLVAFELLREGDKGVSSNRFRFASHKYTWDGFDISEILFATAVDIASESDNLITRNGYSIQPNPTRKFSADVPLYIYFEVYNLKKNQNRLTDFEQEIIITRVGEINEEENVFDSILSFLGLSDKDQIALTSNYQTQEIDPSLYLQIDMSDYEPGEYNITLNLTDKINGKTKTTSSRFIWQ